MNSIVKSGPFKGMKKHPHISPREYRCMLYSFVDPKSSKCATESIMIKDALLENSIFGSRKFAKALRWLMINRGVKIDIYSSNIILTDKQHRHGLFDLLEEAKDNPRLFANKFTWWNSPESFPRLHYVLIDAKTKHAQAIVEDVHV